MTINQQIHPKPYVHPRLGPGGGFPIQIAPPEGPADPLPDNLDELRSAWLRCASAVAGEGEWVSREVANLPVDRMVDRDLILLALVEMWLDHLIQGKGDARINIRRELAPYVSRHPAKSHLMNYDGKPFKVSETWPDNSKHKVLLDRIRKLDRSGWLVLDKLNPLELDPEGLAEHMSGDLSLHTIYLAKPATSGLVRSRHLANRLCHNPLASEGFEMRFAALKLS